MSVNEYMTLAIYVDQRNKTKNNQVKHTNVIKTHLTRDNVKTESTSSPPDSSYSFNPIFQQGYPIFEIQHII